MDFLDSSTNPSLQSFSRLGRLWKSPEECEIAATPRPTSSRFLVPPLDQHWPATLLAGGGGVLTGASTGTGSTGSLALGWPLDPRDRSAILSVTMLGGGLGFLHVGTLVVASAAVLLALRDRLVLLLVGASLAFLIAALTLRYEEAPHDVPDSTATLEISRCWPSLSRSAYVSGRCLASAAMPLPESSSDW